MTHQDYIIKRKLNILELAESLGNISDACRQLGVSRQHYYDIKSLIDEEGLDGLLEKSRRNPRVGNRVSPEIEDKLLAYCLDNPTHGQVRVSNELKRDGVILSPGSVRSIWLRHNLENKSLRLKRLEEWSKSEANILTESQVKALEERKEDIESTDEIETHHPGFLVGQDTYYVGYIKGIGKIYQQTGIDTFSNVGFAKVYTSKDSLVAADFLNDKVLPLFDSYGIKVLRMLTDNGREYCGKAIEHKYELFLHLNEIEHTRTKVRHPRTNGATERLNQTIKNEFYEVAFRKKLYTSLEEVQVDLDSFMDNYNKERTNQGKRCLGKTPLETFTQGLELYNEMVYNYEDSEESAA